ncbi:hypothetical protein [Jiulongibacter sediminis]|uniref:Uncharacterized protein n=1 Tax=Jiulongibacter sediminis TaxID=1605367 RepID=A0A0P7BZI9_9BACT|nr:hypothetical protein [Jiulongibacter sediminis]KPM47070.1 hypothetical protein AFM12_17775 [Jiulongibacter sediminis]TBX22413.1 hypothetical protein TK44_17780 [Jiulongibacter sediminis]
MNRLQNISVFLFLIIVTAACSSKKKDIEPIILNGQYNLTRVNSEITFQDQQPEITDKDVTDQEIYFFFSPDGTYTTNASLGIGNIKKDQKVNSNTYQIENNLLIISIVEADLNVPFKLYLKMTEENNELTLSLNHQDLVNSFDASLSGMDAFSKALIQVLISQIVEMNYSLTLTKEP